MAAPKLGSKQRQTTDTVGRGPSKTGFKDMNRPKKPTIRPDAYLQKALAAMGVTAPVSPMPIEADPRMAVVMQILGQSAAPPPKGKDGDPDDLTDVDDDEDGD